MVEVVSTLVLQQRKAEEEMGHPERHDLPVEAAPDGSSSRDSRYAHFTQIPPSAFLLFLFCFAAVDFIFLFFFFAFLFKAAERVPSSIFCQTESKKGKSQERSLSTARLPVRSTGIAMCLTSPRTIFTCVSPPCGIKSFPSKKKSWLFTCVAVMTVRETLLFSARCTMPKSVPRKAAKHRVCLSNSFILRLVT